MAWKVDGTRSYQDLTVRSLSTLTACAPLTEMEPGRKRFEFPGVVPLVDVKKG
jgi:phenylacetic acid degradation protein